MIKTYLTDYNVINSDSIKAFLGAHPWKGYFLFVKGTCYNIDSMPTEETPNIDEILVKAASDSEDTKKYVTSYSIRDMIRNRSFRHVEGMPRYVYILTDEEIAKFELLLI